LTETIEQAKDVNELNDEVLNEQFSKERTESELERRDADEEDLKSHYLLSRTVVGAVEEKSKGYAKIYFIPTEDMVADKKGLLQGEIEMTYMIPPQPILDFSRKITVRECCYVCRWFTGKYTCNRRQERFVYNMYAIPAWCPGFEVKETLRVER